VENGNKGGLGYREAVEFFVPEPEIRSDSDFVVDFIRQSNKNSVL
jgi:hypothetical protein